MLADSPKQNITDICQKKAQIQENLINLFGLQKKYMLATVLLPG